MISKNAELYCKDPLWKIMGYKEAKYDDSVVYDCHHKAGLYISSKELKKKGYRLFIVSNCQSGYIEAFLEYYKINDYIEDIECFGNNDLPKWDNIALIIKRNNLKNPVYVGDIDNDRIAAGKAGADFIYAEYGFGDVKKYDDIIYKFGDLLRIGEEKWF